MTRITTGCPRCGRVELEVGEVTLVVSPREDSSWYFFDCTGCARLVVKPAPTSVAVALTSVRTAVWTVPAEVLERVAPDERPALVIDDLLDAMLVLECRTHLAALAAGDDPAGDPGPASGPSGSPAGAVRSPRSGGEGSRPARPRGA